MTDVRAHMMRPLESAGGIIKEKVEQPMIENVMGLGEVVWDTYYDFRANFVDQFQVGNLPRRDTPVDSAKTTSVIAGKEVKRMPVLDDFAEMMRKEDVDSHTRLESYVNPIGPAGGLDWFQGGLLATMIDNGRIGIKSDAFGNRAVYAYRSRTGNPFFRIWGGRTTLFIAILQWCILHYVVKAGALLGLSVSDYGFASARSGDWMVMLVALLIFSYNFIHWRFHKRYAFITNYTLVDGWKGRSFPAAGDNKWAKGRMAIHAINLSLISTYIVVTSLYSFSNLGWL